MPWDPGGDSVPNLRFVEVNCLSICRMVRRLLCGELRHGGKHRQQKGVSCHTRRQRGTAKFGCAGPAPVLLQPLLHVLSSFLQPPSHAHLDSRPLLQLNHPRCNRSSAPTVGAPLAINKTPASRRLCLKVFERGRRKTINDRARGFGEHLVVLLTVELSWAQVWPGEDGVPN